MEAKDLSNNNLEMMRHSCAHVMATAILKLYPTAKFGVGPAIKNGFYYDVLVEDGLTERDLVRIEKEMVRIKKRTQPFICETVEVEAAISKMRELEQPFKIELLELLRDKGTTAISKETGDESVVGDDASEITFYRVGDFVDLCRGPHVNDTGKIGAFKLTRIAGAYWRGNSDNQQLQRVYGLCYETTEDVKSEITRIEEQKRRDHRTLGRELELFSFSQEIGSGLPLWLPNGTVIRRELQKLAEETEHAYGYKRVVTPTLAKATLYEQSGHLPYYKEDLYPPMTLEDGLEYYIRPMNCPHHHQVYLSRPRSFRELPLRIAEYGDVYRYEAHGALTGLMRTRGFCQNDAHIYCQMDEAKAEFLRVMRMHSDYYSLFGIEKFYMRLSLPDMERLDKYVDDAESWTKAVEVLREAMIESGLDYEEAEGEAAFYGPKIDFMITSAIGTEYAISTNQLDFLATERFALRYRGSDGEDHPVYVIHRSPLGSHERFTAFLIEHYAGAFPFWLAPMQVMIVPVADRHLDFCHELRRTLEAQEVPTATQGVRVEIDDSNERMQKKIRSAEVRKIPYVLVIGDKEVEAGTIAVRHRDLGDLGVVTPQDLLTRMTAEVKERRDLS